MNLYRRELLSDRQTLTSGKKNWERCRLKLRRSINPPNLGTYYASPFYEPASLLHNRHLIDTLGRFLLLKAWIATIRAGFVLARILAIHNSLSFSHSLAAGKNSLFKHAQGLWVHIIISPLFFILAILFFCAGADYLNLPGVETLNTIMNGGRAGSDWVTFDKRSGYKFPFFPPPKKWWRNYGVLRSA